MALNGPGERIQNYTEKLIPARVAEDLTTKKPGMVAIETIIFNEMCEIEDRCKAILATKTGETVIKSPFYQAFARQAYSIRRKWLGGEVLDIEFAALTDKWKARGLTEASMLQILNEVFAWTPPAP